MALLSGKTALIFGVANDHSIAWGIAQAFAREGATLGFSYAGEALERATITGTPLKKGQRRSGSGRITAKRGGQELADEVADHLRALLRDVICGHLAPDLVALADELLAAPEDPEADAEAQDAGADAEAETRVEEAPVLVEAT